MELLQTHQPTRETHSLKTTRDYVNIIDAYHETGSYRAAALMCGVTHKTARRAVERQQAGGPWVRRSRPVTRNTDPVLSVLAKKVKDTDGPHLGQAAAAFGAGGRLHGLGSQPAPGGGQDQDRAPAEAAPLSTLGSDPGSAPGHRLDPGSGDAIFCAVLAWSRYRFVRFAANETRETTLALLAECFEELGAVPAVVLSDRMSCLKKGVVANVVVPHPEYVRFAAHFGFRPDFCESADPESKGVVEHLAGYVQVDLVVPGEGFGGKLELANRQARVWGLEVNGRVHSEIHKVDRLQTIRFGSARYSPFTISTTAVQLGRRRGALRVRTETERTFLALGPPAPPGWPGSWPRS